MSHRLHTTQSGFSLIELLVSMTIFTIVVTISTSALLVLIDANARALNKQSIMNNFTFALDSMTREIRSGYNYVCSNSSSAPGTPSASATSDCASGGNFISFIESGDGLTSGSGAAKRISYYYDSDLNDGKGAMQRRLGTQDWYTVTDPAVTFDDFEFIVTNTAGFASGNVGQPTVTVYIAGEAGNVANTDTSFRIQSSITQRALDI